MPSVVFREHIPPAVKVRLSTLCDHVCEWRYAIHKRDQPSDSNSCNTFAPEFSQSAGSRMRLWFVTLINTLFYIAIYFIVKVFPRDTINDKL